MQFSKELTFCPLVFFRDCFLKAFFFNMTSVTSAPPKPVLDDFHGLVALLWWCSVGSPFHGIGSADEEIPLPQKTRLICFRCQIVYNVNTMIYTVCLSVHTYVRTYIHGFWGTLTQWNKVIWPYGNTDKKVEIIKCASTIQEEGQEGKEEEKLAFSIRKGNLSAKKMSWIAWRGKYAQICLNLLTLWQLNHFSHCHCPSDGLKRS